MGEILDESGGNSLIVIDSLDDLIRAFPSGKENRLMASMRALQSRNKNQWNSLIINHLTKGIFPGSVEESMLSLVDGVFEFKETSSSGGRAGGRGPETTEGIQVR